MKLFRLAIVIGLIAVCSLVWAGERKYKVKVLIAADEGIKSQVESYIKRELRALHDVVIVGEEENNYDWILSIIGLNSGSYAALSTVASLKLPCEGWNYGNEVVAKIMQSHPYFYAPSNWLNIGEVRQLKSMCERVVADFDTESLKPMRKIYTKLDNFDPLKSGNK